MADQHTISAEMRMERIDRLLHELKYEVERGFMEKEIDESIGFEFIVPVSREIRGGMVYCSFRTRPVHRDSIFGSGLNAPPKLSLATNNGK